METLTKETTLKLRREAANKFIPIAEELEKAGMTEGHIISIYEKYVKSCSNNFYKNNISSYHDLISQFLCAIPDSKAEGIFFNMLSQRNVEFQFQYKIGPYRVDYLICGVVVLECDGPQHDEQREYDRERDKYLEKMGYHVVRLSWSLIAQIPEIVIEEVVLKAKEIRGKKGNKNA